MTAPSVFLGEFALLEMITELSNRKLREGSLVGVDFREQPDYGAPHSSLIRVLFEGANNLLVVNTFATRIDFGPAKLPDFGTSLAIDSFHTPMSHLSPPARSCGAEESSGIEASRGGLNHPE
jgi:hypothetical protein